MPLEAGTRLGVYEILAPLGAGGMGEVYRARDARLGRDVAIKVCAAHFSDRFEREARAIAALNHPAICTLHDIGPNYLVMELVDGPTLADRIGQGPLPADEALRIARLIADALQSAHDKGIVHRDLKPANVKITPAGDVKVLDFGLAKLDGDSGLSGSGITSTLTTPDPTREGVVLGTVAYMAPEQARGLAVDKRADIWSFGVVLYEMLTGARPFAGATASDTIAAILTKEPDWTTVPARMRPMLQRCLAKDPRVRLRDIGDLDLLLHAAPVQAARTSWLPWGIAAALLIALAVLGFRYQRPTPASPSMRFQIPATVEIADTGNVGVSPDGRYLAFLAGDAERDMRVWIRSLDALEVRPLPGTEITGAGPPLFWSHDSRFIAFDAGRKLKKVAVTGGPPETLCDLPGVAVGGSWNRDGVILVGNSAGGILRVSESGGDCTPVTSVDPSIPRDIHVLPSFLPDGRHFVYLRPSRGREGVYVGSLDAKPGQTDTRLMDYARGLSYVPPVGSEPGHLLFVRAGSLLAQPFDDRRPALAGQPRPVAQHVGTFLDTGFFSASANGVLVYRTVDREYQIAWFDRHGINVGTVLEPSWLVSLALSRDATHAAASRTNQDDPAISDLWILDLAGSPGATRFTFGTDDVRSDFPVWSADGTRMFYSSGARGERGIVQQVVGGPRTQEPLVDVGRRTTPTSVSADDAFLMFASLDPVGRWDLWVRPMKGDRKPMPFAQSEFDETQGQISTDARWVAYVSNESGANEVYVRRFLTSDAGSAAAAGSGKLVSRGGGTTPRWRADGKELFYLSKTGQMMAVSIVAGERVESGVPTGLFQTPPGAIVGGVTADGSRFLLASPIDGGGPATPFTVIVNWLAGLP